MTSRSWTRKASNYLIESGDGTREDLSPIVGYACQPVVPLDEACRPLELILPKLRHHIAVAKERSTEPTSSLTVDEAAAIRLYTMQWEAHADGPNLSLYAQLNQTLRHPDREKLRPWFPYLKLLLIGLSKLPVTSAKSVWRGIREQDTSKYTEGDEMIWWAFSSCTTSLNVLNSDLFLGKTGQRAIFAIETFDGRSVAQFSDFPSEEEILLLPGTCLKVFAKLNPAPDLHIIELKQVTPQRQLIERPFNASDPLTHTIRAGDTFWSLAVEYNCAIEAIEAMNPGVDYTQLEIGQVIRLPNALLFQSAPKERTEHDSPLRTHTVFVGDTLKRIAEWYHCTTDELMLLNPALQPNLLYPGQQLRLPSTERTRESLSLHQLPFLPLTHSQLAKRH